jgi:hypothetical protein
MAEVQTDDVRAELELQRQLATLTATAVAPPTAATALQAVVWANGLQRLGLTAPLVVVHDLGQVLASADARRGVLAATALHRPDASVLGRYRSLLAAVAGSEVLDALGGAILRDEVIIVVLARLLGDVQRRWAGAAHGRPTAPLPLTSSAYTRDLTTLTILHPTGWITPFLQLLLDEQAGLLIRLEQLELGVVRLFGLFPPGAATADLLDLYQAMTTVGAASAADFSLQLLPSLLETKRSLATQRFAVDGYASVERRGSLDALLPTELAHDPDIFAQRALGDELLFYGHERPPESSRRVHGILIDASASMRGAREVFARGLGIALAKKLCLMGAEVWLSFFDSRLHRRVDVSALGGKELPYVLSFRSEQGRNYGRVFEQLRAELQRDQRRRPRELSVTFITHAECHAPVAAVEAVARLAALYGIFVMPSQALALEYLPTLRGHQIVSRESLAAPAEKRRRALEIVNEVAGRGAARARAS